MKLCDFDDTQVGSTKIIIEEVQDIDDMDKNFTHRERIRDTLWVCPPCRKELDDGLATLTEIQGCGEAETIEVLGVGKQHEN